MAVPTGVPPAAPKGFSSFAEYLRNLSPEEKARLGNSVYAEWFKNLPSEEQVRIEAESEIREKRDQEAEERFQEAFSGLGQDIQWYREQIGLLGVLSINKSLDFYKANRHLLEKVILVSREMLKTDVPYYIHLLILDRSQQHPYSPELFEKILDYLATHPDIKTADFKALLGRYEEFKDDPAEFEKIAEAL